MNWLQSNLVPAWNESAWSVIDGGATIASDKLTLPVNSTIRLKLENGEALLGSSHMLFKVTFDGTFDSMSEYVPLCSIGIVINYLDNTKQNSMIMFNRYEVINGLYQDNTELEVETKNINSIDIYINNSADALGTLYINNIEIYKSEDVNSAQIAQAVSETISLKSMDEYDNGLMVNFKGDIESIKIEYIKGGTNEFLGILVDDEDFLPWSRINGMLPEKIIEGA